MRDGTELRFRRIPTRRRRSPSPPFSAERHTTKSAISLSNNPPPSSKTDTQSSCKDVRGRYASGGELKLGFFSSDVHDAEDGYDTVEWAAVQTLVQRARRDVGQFLRRLDAVGHGTHSPAAPRHHDPRHDRSRPARTGAVRRAAPGPRPYLVRHQPERGHPHTLRSARRTGTGTKRRGSSSKKDRSKWLWYLPLSEIPQEALGGTGDLWRTWLADHATDHFGFKETHHETDVPVLSLTGWYDQQIGTIKHFTGMSANGMTAFAPQQPTADRRSLDTRLRPERSRRRSRFRTGCGRRLRRALRRLVRSMAQGGPR